MNVKTCTQFAVCAILLAWIQTAAAAYQVTIDTPGLSGTTASMAFDFIDGGPPSNGITVGTFSTDGTLGAATPTGGVTGALPSGFVLTDTTFFNEYLQNNVLGGSIAFTFSATSNAPAGASIPDTFSFFLIDPGTGLPLFNTTDPTGAASLFTLQIDGSADGLLSVYRDSATGSSVNWTVTDLAAVAAVPEPATAILVGLGLLVVLAQVSGRRRASIS
jgi:hypothetical protein